MPISRAAAPRALPLSVQRMAPFARMSLRAAPMCSLSALSSTKSAVLPVRSRQINTGIWFVRQTALRCLTAPLARRTRHSALLAFERSEEEGFIRFSNARKTHSLLLVGQGEKPMAPAECRVAMHFTGFRAFAYALSFRHLPRVLQGTSKNSYFVAPAKAGVQSNQQAGFPPSPRLCEGDGE